jgi:FkbM family methyltransferase
MSTHAFPELPLVGLNELVTLDRWTLERRARALARPLYLGDGVALGVILGRYKFYVDTRDVGFGAHVLLDGCWEPWLTVFMARRIKPGMSVLDVGANHGYYTMLFADLVGPEGKVAAVECNPNLCQLLRRSIMVNGFSSRVELLEQAAMDREGSVTIYIDPTEPKNARVIGGHEAFASGAVSVRGGALANDLKAWKKLDFVKIDIEGSEEAAVAGLWPMIKRDKPDMLLEFNVHRCADGAGLLAKLRKLYGEIRVVDFDAETQAIEDAALLDTRSREDWMLFLSTGKDSQP